MSENEVFEEKQMLDTADAGSLSKYFNNLWLRLFVGIAFTFAIQIFCSFLSVKLFPSSTEGTSALFVTFLPLYILGYPCIYLLLKNIPQTMPIEKHKMKVGHIFAGVVLAICILYVSNIAGMILSRIIAAIIGNKAEVVLETLVNSGGALIILAFFVAICAPVAEEFIFRKLIIDRTVKYGEMLSILVSAFIFALFHGNLGQAIYAFPLGMLFAYIYIRTGNIKNSMIIHCIVNTVGTVFPAIMRQYIDVSKITEFSASNDLMGLANYLSSNVAGFVMLLIQEMIVYGCIVAGIVLFIIAICKHQFWVVKRETDIPKKSRIKIVMINAGMILLVVLLLVFIIMQLFGIKINF